jgi:hydrogenase nickel incorporation protein HypA/HybF
VAFLHEMAIAQGVLDIALQTAAQHDASRISKISLLVGQLTEVEPDSLRFCFTALAADTPAADAELVVTIVPLRGRCRDCGRNFAIENYRFSCPDCSSTGVEILSGRELKVEHLEVE